MAFVGGGGGGGLGGTWVNPSPLLPQRREVLVVHIIFCLRNILHKIGQPLMNKVESGRNRYYSCFSTSLIIRYMIMYYSYHSLHWGVTLLHTLKKTFRSLVSFSFRNQFLLYNRGWLSRQVYDSCPYFHQISKSVKNVTVARTRPTGNVESALTNGVQINAWTNPYKSLWRLLFGVYVDVGRSKISKEIIN